MNDKIVPVLVINWNGIDDTIQCINSLLNQSYEKIAVYVLDNASKNQEGQKIAQYYQEKSNVHFYQSEKNLGFTKGSNYLYSKIKEADFDFIGMLNNDAFAEKDWIEKMVQFATSENVDVISCKIYNFFDETKLDNIGHQMLNTGEIIPIGFESNSDRYQNSFENMGSCAGATLYRDSMIKQIGLFDEFFDTGYEDAEFGVRAKILGYKCAYCPDAKVKHKISQSLSKIMDESYLSTIQLNIFYSYFKLMPRAFIFFNMPFFFMKYAAVLIIDIIFRRHYYKAIMTTAIKETRTRFPEIMRARKAFHDKHRTISSWKIFKMMRFFLIFDIKRFYKHILKSET